jgi:hypothetical protein
MFLFYVNMLCCCVILQMLELIAHYSRIKYGPGSCEISDTNTPAAERHAAIQRFNAAYKEAAAAAAASGAAAVSGAAAGDAAAGQEQASGAAAGEDVEMAPAAPVEEATPAAAVSTAGGSSSSKQSAVQPFLFLTTPRSLGLGSELPGLSAALLYESDWHPRLDMQALRR